MHDSDNNICKSEIVSYTHPMNFDFSNAKAPAPNLSLRLHAVYCLHADPSYDVRKALPRSEEWVVLRTMAGHGCVLLEGHSEISVTAGTLLYFKHQDIRRYHCSGEAWHFYWFEFSSENLFRFPENTLLQIGSIAHEQEDCQTCLEMLRKDDTDAGPRASAFLSLLVYKWYMALGTKDKKNPYHDLIQQILLDVHSRTDVNVNVSSMARKAGLCERRFRQVFELEMGVSPKKHLESMKMNMAEAMLRNTSLLLGEISDRLGYCNPYHFSRRFHATHGMSPSLYRKT